jgi:hypothetical protein
MHEMMGIKEDTPEHENLHVHIARMMYCGQGMTGNMMPMMGMMHGGMMPMMHGGMMGGNYAPGMMNYRTGGMMGPGMMGGSYAPKMMDSWAGGWNIASILWVILLAGFVVAVWLWVFKLFKETFGKKK